MLYFIFGLFVGSFLNCVIYRIEKGKSFITGRSFCPRCNHELAWYDLIPVFSFLVLKGKCRYCQKRISMQYPLIELLTGFLFFLAGFYFGFNLYALLMIPLFIIIAVYDLKHFLIPDKVVYLAIGLALLASLVSFQWQNIVAGLSASLFFFLIWHFSKGKWMGFGDVQIALAMGFFLGFPNILVGLFLSFFIGAVTGIVLMMLKRKKMKSEVPFGGFLVLGTFLALFFGNEIVNWYLSLL